jgi:hypothetical protein
VQAAAEAPLTANKPANATAAAAAEEQEESADDGIDRGNLTRSQLADEQQQPGHGDRGALAPRQRHKTAHSQLEVLPEDDSVGGEEDAAAAAGAVLGVAADASKRHDWSLRAS